MLEIKIAGEYRPFYWLGIDGWNYDKKLVIKTIALQPAPWRSALISNLTITKSNSNEQETNNRLFIYVASLGGKGRQTLVESLGI